MSERQSQRPAPDGFATWPAYWEARAMPWRTEPEIDAERQQYLAERRGITPDMAKGIYPFKDVTLDRADVEWLLATHESSGMRGPVEWSDKKQRERVGIDLRGADLRDAALRGLPLARLIGGLEHMAAYETSRRQRFLAVVHLEGADLADAHLEGAFLGRARLERADLTRAYLYHADLYAAHVEGANLSYARLGGTILRDTYFHRSTYLDYAEGYDGEHGAFRVLDVRWGGVKLATIRWAHVRMLGEEAVAWQRKTSAGAPKAPARRLIQFERAVRANRQVALELRAQGLSEIADRFAYRAQVLQRHLLRRQGHLLRSAGALLLDLISGYGYKPLRSFLTYMIVVLGFAAAYYFLVPLTGVHFEPLGAVVFSVTSFHGRGFSPGEGVALTNLVTVLAAGEAIIGLLIEITFIATFTQRFFAR